MIGTRPHVDQMFGSLDYSIFNDAADDDSPGILWGDGIMDDWVDPNTVTTPRGTMVKIEDLDWITLSPDGTVLTLPLWPLRYVDHPEYFTNLSKPYISVDITCPGATGSVAIYYYNLQIQIQFVGFDWPGTTITPTYGVSCCAASGPDPDWHGGTVGGPPLLVIPINSGIFSPVA
jgi:hypothetical protein